MRLIDADVLLDSIFKSCNTTEATINNAPTIDAVSVVRCKDCKHYILGPFGMGCMVHFNHKTDIFTHNPYDYCSYGEKMEGKP